MDILKQRLIENIADILDSEDVQREEFLSGISDPVKIEETELHIRMAEAALSEYKRTCDSKNFKREQADELLPHVSKPMGTFCPSKDKCACFMESECFADTSLKYGCYRAK